jgi:hypothetical protein
MLLHIINTSDQLVTVPLLEGAFRSVRLRRKYDDVVVDLDWTKEQFVSWLNKPEIQLLKNGTPTAPTAAIVVFLYIGPVDKALASLIDIQR